VLRDGMALRRRQPPQPRGLRVVASHAVAGRVHDAEVVLPVGVALRRREPIQPHSIRAPSWIAAASPRAASRRSSLMLGVIVAIANIRQLQLKSINAIASGWRFEPRLDATRPERDRERGTMAATAAGDF
jgi:hypothetical protein